MDRNTILAVQSSWLAVLDKAPAAGELFYANLFETDPSLRYLFRGNLYEQAQKLIEMITETVRLLDDMEKLMPALQLLGQRHNDYHVSDGDYDTVGDVLIETLEHALGDALTPTTRQAWIVVYDTLAKVMITGAPVHI